MDGRWSTCNSMSDLSEQHDACHGNVVGRDAAEPGQQLVGVDELATVQAPCQGDEKLGCLALGRGEEAMRRGHARSFWPGAAVRPDLRMLYHGRRHPIRHIADAVKHHERQASRSSTTCQ